jgi:hypothetical protein
LETIRTDPTVQAIVQQHLKSLGVNSAAELQLDPSGSVKGKQPVSGRVSKIDNNIQRQLTWPHSVLDPKFTSNSITYDSLDFPLLVAGEIAICLDREKTSQEEADFRLKLVKELCYSVRVSHWNTTKNFHSAALLDIERGTKYSEYSLAELTTSSLTAQAQLQANQLSSRQNSENQWAGSNNFRNKQRKRQPNRDRPKGSHLFCRLYNQGTCPFSTDHMGELDGETVLLEHICASCYIAVKEANRHSEIKDKCSRYVPRR